jgi:rRNA-processing protein FCF1
VRTRLTARPSGSPPDRSDGERPPTPRVVLLDTNALLLPFRSRFPLLEEIARLTAPARVAVPGSVLAELDRLVERRIPGAAPARTFARRFPIVASSGRGDLGLLTLAVRRGAVVVTGDRELRRRLLAAGISVLSPKGSVRLARWDPTGASVPSEKRRRATVKNGAPLAGRPPRERPHAARRR